MRRIRWLLGVIGLGLVLISVLVGGAMFWFRGETQPIAVWEIGDIRSAAFSGNDQLVVAGSDQTTIRHVPNNQILKIIPTGGYLAVHPNRTLIALGRQGQVVLYDLERDERIATLDCWPSDRSIYPMSLAFSPDGLLLAVSEAHHSRGPEVQLWHVESRLQVDTIRIDDNEASVIQTVAFSPDGGYLVAGAVPRGVWLIDVAQRRVEQKIQPHPTGSIAFSPDGSRLILGGKTIRAYDTSTWNLVYELTFPDPVRDCPAPEEFFLSSMHVAVSPDGRWLATPDRLPPSDSFSWFEPGPPRQTIAVRRLTDGQRRHILSGSPIRLHQLHFSPDGQWLIDVGLSAIRVWPVAD